MNVLDDLVREFLDESRRNLERVDRDLRALAKDSGNREWLADAFRAFHSIKGACGFLHYPKLEALGHCGESELAKLRDGASEPDPDDLATLRRLIEDMGAMLDRIEATGAEDGTPGVASRSEAPCAVREASSGPRMVCVDARLIDRILALTGELALLRRDLEDAAIPFRDPRVKAGVSCAGVLSCRLQERASPPRPRAGAAFWSRLPTLVRELADDAHKQVCLEMEGVETVGEEVLLKKLHDPLTHLLRNAVDHGIESPERRVARGKSPEGVVTLRVVEGGGVTRIEVQDDGAGIESERVRRQAAALGLISAFEAARLTDQQVIGLIFHPGLTTAAQVTRTSGRGVGLDVVKSAVETLGGTIALRSRPGRGAVFTLSFGRVTTDQSRRSPPLRRETTALAFPARMPVMAAGFCRNR